MDYRKENTNDYKVLYRGYIGISLLLAHVVRGMSPCGRHGTVNSTSIWKVTYDTATQYLPKDVAQVGTSLGSFSVDGSILLLLLCSCCYYHQLDCASC